MSSKILKIAVLSDVHGNLPALEAVLADCKKRRAEQIWYLGDFIGYVPYPNEVVQYLRNMNAISIIGNYDIKVLSFARKARQWKIYKTHEKYSILEWNYKALSRATKRYLRTLPKERRFRIGGLKILLTHGSHVDNEEGIGSTTPVKRLNELAKLSKADVVLCGHFHRPFKKLINGVLFVNSGSVGRPEGDTRASYAILYFHCGRIVVKHYKVEYDITKAANAIRKAALSAGLTDVLEKAASLDTLKKQRENILSEKITDKKKLKSVLALAEKCNYERQHTHQVEKLALQLFDGLTKLHRLGTKERMLLRYGALLHDIGWLEGCQAHHKTALRIIMETVNLPFNFRDKSIIALLARYHRKALPFNGHAYYCQLSSKDKIIVQKLASILRIADGLDRSHRMLVQNIDLSFKSGKILLTCSSTEPLDEEFNTAIKKTDLFTLVFGKKIVFCRKLMFEPKLKK